MAKIFISHASEDKEAIARPLAQRLSLRHQVWFDEYELKLGDSLRGKIDEGLRACDYGVVILSKSFFAKKWPVTELDGLFALETANRKIMLPVWHGIGEAEVKEFSPILAGRKAVQSSKGIEVVLDEIESAVSVSQRTRELVTAPPGREAVRNLAKRLLAADFERDFISTPEGAMAVQQSAQSVLQAIIAALDDAGGGKFRADKQDHHSVLMTVYGPYRMRAEIGMRALYINDASRSELIYILHFPDDTGADTFYVADELTLRPRAITSKEILWQEKDVAHAPVLSVAPTADAILERMVQQVDIVRQERGP